MADDKKIFSTLNQLLKNTNIEGLNADSQIFEDLKDGYYLSEVEKAELKSSKAGAPMASFQFKVVEDGYEVEISETGEVTLKKIDKSKGRKIFMNFVLTDETAIKRFVTNMLKFEEEPGVPLLEKDAFTDAEILAEALDALIGSQIYINVSSSVKADGSKGVWNNLISWTRAAKLELPMD